MCTKTLKRSHVLPPSGGMLVSVLECWSCRYVCSHTNSGWRYVRMVGVHIWISRQLEIVAIKSMVICFPMLPRQLIHDDEIFPKTDQHASEHGMNLITHVTLSRIHIALPFVSTS